MRFHEFQKLKEFDASSSISQAANIINLLSNPFSSLTGGGDDTASSPTPNVNIGSGSNKSVDPNDILSYLQKKMDNNKALGILANIKAESGYRPGVLITDTNNKPSGGLFQHNGERFTKMVNAVGTDWATDWQGQIDYALSEPEGQSYVSKQFNNAAEATAWWTKNFERPKNPEQQAAARINLLKNLG